MNIDNPTDLPPGSRKPWRQLMDTVRDIETKLGRITGNSSAATSGVGYYTQTQVDDMFKLLSDRLAKLEPEGTEIQPYRPSKW